MGILAKSVALALAGIVSAACAAQPLYFTTDQPLAPPAPQFKHLPHFVSDVRDVASRAGVGYRITRYPWKRAYAIALERKDACVFLTTRTPERERLFKWVGPIRESEWVLAGRAGVDYKIRTLEDARKYRIGTFIGDARHEYLRSRGFKVDVVQDDNVNPEKLLLGRIDLWASASWAGGPEEYRSLYPGQIVAVLKFNTVGLYLACNKAVPDADIARLNRAAAEFRADRARAPAGTR